MKKKEVLNYDTKIENPKSDMINLLVSSRENKFKVCLTWTSKEM